MPTNKDDQTEQLRVLLSHSKKIQETDAADSGLSTLSYQSKETPRRNVWIDTDLAGNIKVDIEDLDNDEKWDNSVATFTPTDINICAIITLTWLCGGSILECSEIADRRPMQ